MSFGKGAAALLKRPLSFGKRASTTDATSSHHASSPLKPPTTPNAHPPGGPLEAIQGSSEDEKSGYSSEEGSADKRRKRRDSYEKSKPLETLNTIDYDGEEQGEDGVEANDPSPTNEVLYAHDHDTTKRNESPFETSPVPPVPPPRRRTGATPGGGGGSGTPPYPVGRFTPPQQQPHSPPDRATTQPRNPINTIEDPDYNPDLTPKALTPPEDGGSGSSDQAVSSGRSGRSSMTTKLPPDQPWVKLLRARNLHEMAVAAEEAQSVIAETPSAGSRTPYYLTPAPSDFETSLAATMGPQYDWLSKSLSNAEANSAANSPAAAHKSGAGRSKQHQDVDSSPLLSPVDSALAAAASERLWAVEAQRMEAERLNSLRASDDGGALRESFLSPATGDTGTPVQPPPQQQPGARPEIFSRFHRAESFKRYEGGCICIAQDPQQRKHREARSRSRAGEGA